MTTANKDGNTIGRADLEREIERREVAEKRLRAALVALKEARQPAADAGQELREFLEMVNHQMRGPLASVLNAFGLLADSALTSEQNDWVAAGLHGARALLYQINQLAELGQLETRAVELEPSDVAVADLLDDVVDLFTPQVRSERVELFARLAPEAGARIHCDVGRVRQVLINLLSLALGSRQGDRVLLEAELAGVELVLRARAPHRRPALKGQPAGERQPAVLTAEVGELGLMITRRVVQLLGGSVTLADVPEEGLTVTARLPWQPARQARDRRIASLLDKARATRVAVLADDDEPSLIVEALARWGVPHRRFDRPRALQRAAYEADVVVAEGDLATLLRATAREGLRSVGILPQFAPRPDPANQPGNLLLQLLPASERDLIQLLCAPEEAFASDLRADTRVPAAEHPCSVLVAEDNLANRMITTRMLEKMGHRVHGVGDGREVVKAARQSEFDVVLMDLKMPHVDGLEATRQILGDPHVTSPPAIIALTGDTSAERRAACLQAGMREFLSKPVAAAQLAALVDRFGRETQLARLRQSLSGHEALPLVDRSALVRMAKEVDASLIPELGSQFLLEIDARIAEATRAVERRDYGLVRTSLHTLVSTAASFGARQLTAVIRQVEKLATGSDPELLGQFMAVLAQVAAKTSAALAAELRSRRPV